MGHGDGEATIGTAEPHAGEEGTDSGVNRDRRRLKQRARGGTRTVPCTPESTPTPVDGRISPDTLGRTSKAPDRLRAGQGPFVVVPPVAVPKGRGQSRPAVYAGSLVG